MRKLLLGLVLALSACVHGAPHAAPQPEARPYAVGRDAQADVDAALLRAKARGTRLLLVMGANWGHDSRALAGLLQSPRFAELIDVHF